MGKIKSGILGGFSGKVGGVIGSSWKGIDVIKSRPASVANPKSSGQVAQRGKMANISAFASKINADFIKPMWDRFQTQKSGYNAFVQTNIALFASALPSVFASLVISTGKMAATAQGISESVSGQAEWEATFVDDSGAGYKLGTDVCYGICINETTGEVVASQADYTRSDEICVFTFSENLAADDVIHSYLAFRRADGTIVSNASYQTHVML